MKEIKQYIRNFDEQIEIAHQQMQNTFLKISTADENIRSAIQNFQKNIEKLTITNDNRYSKELQNFLRKCQNNSQEWCASIDAFIDGREFVNQFERSILVVVFGNVNVGKSSVGNLIAGVVTPDGKNDIKPDKERMEEYFGPAPEFYEYDLAGSKKAQGARKSENLYFKEGYVETTANIQYYTRNKGLTWTDSPGICSVTKQNGDLAKKYVEFADMVIFVTTSSSPAKFDELQELKNLFSKKKKVLILISKSDKNRKDEVDGKIISILCPKSDEDRKKQEQYAKEAFEREAGIEVSDLDAISVSTLLALKGIKDQNVQEFDNSGFPRFLKKLGEICSKNAVELKMSAPRNRINSMIDELIKGGSLGERKIVGISEYKEQMRQMLKEMQQIKEGMAKAANDSIPQITTQVMNEVIASIQDASQNARSGKKTLLDTQMNAIITKVTIEVLQEQFGSILQEESIKFNGLPQFKGISGMEIMPTMENISRTVYDVREYARAPQGLLEHLEHWILKTNFTETKIISREVTDSFVNGDNASAITDKAIQQVHTTIIDYVKAVMENMQREYFSEIERVIKQLIEKFQLLEESIIKEKLI